jgi:hypothetical protein
MRMENTTNSPIGDLLDVADERRRGLSHRRSLIYIISVQISCLHPQTSPDFRQICPQSVLIAENSSIGY